MRLFNTIALEIGARCNRRCAFCPVAYNKRPKEWMDTDAIAEAVSQLAALNYSGRIEWYIYNEPCMDMDRLATAAAIANAGAPRATQMVATNGDYFKNPDGLLAVYETGIQQVLVNCYTEGLYEKRSHWLDAAAEAGINVGGPIYSPVPRNRRTLQMVDKSGPDPFGTGVFAITNRAGNIGQYLAATPEPIARMCVRPFRVLNINWRGEAMVCCNDYHADVEVGRFPETSLQDLWNSPVLNTYRQHLAAKDRSLPLCSTCDCHSGAYPSNVDVPTQASTATPTEIRSRYDARKAAR